MIYNYFLDFIKLRKIEENNTDIIRSYKNKKNIYIILSLVTFLIFVTLAYNLSPFYLLGLLISIISLGLSSKYNREFIGKTIAFEWKKSSLFKNNKKSEEEFKKIRSYFDFNLKDDKRSIDDATWNDLNMDDLYSKMDRTYTSSGKSILYNILRSPQFSKADLSERTKIINLISSNKSFREKLIYTLNEIGLDKYHNLEYLLFDDELPKPSKYNIIYEVLGMLGFLSLGMIYFFQKEALLFIIAPLFIVNGIIFLLLKNKFQGKIPGVIELRKLIVASYKISMIKEPEMMDISKVLKTLYKTTGSILRKTKKIIPSIKSFLHFFHDYINILALIEVRAYYSSIKHINKNIEDLRDIYYWVGFLDSCQAVASYKLRNEENISAPEFVDNEIILQADNINHPLIDDPISNDIKIDDSGNGVIITGSNMSGKTTFLRTLGINIILAQTLNFSHAKIFKTSFFLPMSSINQKDSLAKGKSFYYCEAERILEIINKCENDNEIVHFCIFDEILKGTNTKERLSASIGILKYLEKLNVINIIATHDIALANEMGSFETYHFIDNVTEEGLHFDFKLKQGISNSSNAIRLLEFMNYPEKVIEYANG